MKKVRLLGLVILYMYYNKKNINQSLYENIYISWSGSNKINTPWSMMYNNIQNINHPEIKEKYGSFVDVINNDLPISDRLIKLKKKWIDVIYKYYNDGLIDTFNIKFLYNKIKNINLYDFKIILKDEYAYHGHSDSARYDKKYKSVIILGYPSDEPTPSPEEIVENYSRIIKKEIPADDINRDSVELEEYLSDLPDNADKHIQLIFLKDKLISDIKSLLEKHDEYLGIYEFRGDNSKLVLSGEADPQKKTHV